MKLFPPDPEIKLYETGFGDSDPFNRVETGKSLSSLVERIEDPLVIALDGGWGSGKTWFLKRWVGAHKLENGGNATTVYFDAFAHDFMDDPIIGLIGVIGDQLPDKSKKTVWSKVKVAGAMLARPVTRIGLAAATSGLSEVAGPVITAATTATTKEVEAAAESFWAREDGNRAAMHQLRAALIELTKIGVKKGDSAVPLVVVVDELDRCRPDYALALLEVIKHFFSVPNVHFLLGVNMEALGHSVRARYGAGIDAERYLRRFISLSLHLPDQTSGHDVMPLVVDYFRHMATVMKINPKASEVLEQQLQIAVRANSLTMRDMNQLLSSLALVDPKAFTEREFGWGEILSSMLLFRIAQPQLLNKALAGKLSLKDVHDFYGIRRQELDQQDHENYCHPAWLISVLWNVVISDGAKPEADREELPRAFNTFGYRNVRKVPEVLHKNYLSKFALIDADQ